MTESTWRPAVEVRRPVLCGGMVLLAACVGGDRVDVPIHTVSRGDFVHRVTADGHLEAAQATPISVPTAVRRPYRLAWIAPEGRPVESGDVVVRFDPSQLEESLAESRAESETIRLEIVKHSVSAAAELKNLQSDAQLASKELDTARSFQKQDEEVFSRFEIIESEIDEELSAIRFQHAEEGRVTGDDLSRTELELLQIELRQIEQEIQQAEQALRVLEVAAPHSGILLIERNWQGVPRRTGDTLFSGQKVAEIPDLAEMQAQVYVLEADAGGIAVGQEATVVVEARPDTTYAARVSRVDSLAQPRIEGSPVQYFGVTLELERTDLRVMKPGQRVTAQILIHDLEDVLVVPRQALVEEGNNRYVLRQMSRTFDRVEVEVQAAGLGQVVVTGGLSVGDRIAARQPEGGLESIDNHNGQRRSSAGSENLAGTQ